MDVWLLGATKDLSIVTLNIDQYVQQTINLKAISAKFPAVKEQIDVVQQLFPIFIEHQIEVTKDDQQSLIKTIKNRDKLSEVIMRAEDGAERNLERFAQDVQKKLIPQLNTSILELEMMVTNSKFESKDISMDEAIDELEDLNKQFQKIKSDSIRYNKYEETLNLAMTRFENVEILETQLYARLDMWTSLRDWQTLSEKWISGKFNQINTDEIKTKGEYYSKIVVKCSRALPPNPVIKELKERVF